MSELVSIIMPSYNTGRYIAESIRSVLAQTWQDWELLIVDDGSTDDTVDVIRQFDDPRIRFFCLKKNSGTALSRNLALREAKGRWIAFLDSDDLWMPEKLERQIAFMKEKGCHFSYTDYCEIDEQSRESGWHVTGPKHISRFGCLCYCWPGSLTVMYDREMVGLVQIEDLKKHNDYAMWLKVSRHADCYLLKECLGKYRRRKGSISNVGYVRQIRHFYRLWRVGEKCTTIGAVCRTGVNLIFGLSKKIVYVKRK